MSTPTIEVVITTYRRPENLLPIINTIRGQPVNRITIVDATPMGEIRPEEALKLADRVIPMTQNYGGFNRFVPLLAYGEDYTLFLDDDFISGHLAIETMLEAAEQFADFGVMGQLGRIFPSAKYNYEDVTAGEEWCREVDSVIRAYLVRTENLASVAAMYWSMNRAMRENVHLNDDLLLCFAMSYAGLPNFVYNPKSDHGKIILEGLPEPHAVWRREDHTSTRQRFLDYVKAKLGWNTVA